MKSLSELIVEGVTDNKKIAIFCKFKYYELN